MSLVWYKTILVWVHLIGATCWIGGMVFLSIVVAPLLREKIPDFQAHDWFVRVARRFRSLVWMVIPVLVLTGLLLLRQSVWWDVPWAEWSWVVHGKLMAVTMLIALSVVHDRIVGPRVRMIVQKDRSAWTDAERRLVRLSPWLARSTLLLGLLIVFLGVALARS